MNNVVVVGHPLVQHKLTLMRTASRSTKGFRQLLNEIGMLLCYEVTRDLPIELVEVETPLTKMMAPRIAGKKLVFVPICGPGSDSSTACSTSCHRRAWPTSGFIAIPKPSRPWNITSRPRPTSTSA